MKVYLAGPMSGIPHHNRPLFEAKAAEWREEGHEVVSPIELDDEAELTPSADGSIEPHVYAQCMRRAVRALLECEAVVMLSGWGLSDGALFERNVARICGIPVIYGEAESA